MPFPEPRVRPDFFATDFDQSPFIVLWEVTQACALACRHCRAQARPFRDPLELSTQEGFRLTDQIRALGHPLFVLSGGDPLYRTDVFEFIEYAVRLGLRVAMTPAGTERMTDEVVTKLKEKGLARLAVSLDGSTQMLHDAFRGVEGSFGWTMKSLRSASQIGLSVQVNTTVTRHNVHDVQATAALLRSLDISLWSVFFLVPTGRAQRSEMISAQQHEEVFHQLYDLSQDAPYEIKTTAAPHYRRVVLQRRAAEGKTEATDREFRPRMETGGWGLLPPGLADSPIQQANARKEPSVQSRRAAKGVNDGNGLVFISHTGEVQPSGFLPLSAGNVRNQSLADLYRNSELFRLCRSHQLLEGKCGTCDFRDVCGGSRARAYAVTGNLLASEPCCIYQPPKQEKEKRGVQSS